MKWLTTRVYNRFDVIWICWMFGLLIEDRYLAALGIVLAGGIVSAILEVVFNKA